MLAEQWETGSVPASAAACAALLGGTKAEWTRAWPALSICFVTRKRDGRLVNPKLEAVRRERLKYRKAQSKSGLRGAEKRWKKHGEPIGSPSKPIATPMAKNGSSSSSSSDLHLQDGQPPLLPAINARSKRPIFKGQRLVVFEWMLDDLMKMLGPLTDAFDLHGWFDMLDRQAVSASCVIPQHDGGGWLKAETFAEALRRGLPIAVSPNGSTIGKHTTKMAAAVTNTTT